MKESLSNDFLSKKVKSFMELADLTTTKIHDIQDDKRALLRLEEIKKENHFNKLKKQVISKGKQLNCAQKQIEKLERKLIAKDEEIKRLYAIIETLRPPNGK